CLLGIVILMWAARRVVPGLSIKPALHARQMRRMLRFCGYTSLGRLSYLMHFQSDKVILGILLGTSYVTFYSVPLSLILQLLVISKITRLFSGHAAGILFSRLYPLTPIMGVSGVAA